MKPTEHAPLKPLLRLAPLQPGESLPSLLARLTILKHYASPKIFQRLSRSEWPDSPECPSRSSTLRNFAQLTCIDVLDLYTASDLVMVSAQAWANSSPWYPPDLTQPIPYWNWLPVSGMVHAAKPSRFCPQCLMDGAYHRSIWRVVPIAICLTHKCLLIEKCPHCSASVSIRDIVLARCSRCRFDLRQTPTYSVLNETWGHTAQGTLWAWLRGQSTVDENLRWPNHPPPFLWDIAEGLTRMMLCFPDRFPSHALAPSSPRKVHSSNYTLKALRSSEIFWAYSYALKFMADWPQGFREFLHYCAPKRDIDLEKGAGFLYSSWLRKRWKNDNFKFIQEAFDTFRLDRISFPAVEYGGESFERAFAYATLNEAAQILQIPKYSIQRLRQMGLVRTVGTTTGVFCLRSDLLELKRHWSEPLSVEEAAIWLGITPEIVVGLTREYALKPEAKP